MNIDLIVDNTGSLTTGETAIDTHLDLTHTVTIRGKGDLAASNAGSADAVVIGPGIGFSSVPDWSTCNKPLVVLSRAMWVQLGYSTSQGTAYSGGAVNNNPHGAVHPTHVGYPVGAWTAFEVAVLDTGVQWRYPADPPAALDPRWVHYTTSVAFQTVLFTVEASASLLSAKTAVARHAAWGLNADAVAATLTAAGEDVFDGMLAWVVPTQPFVFRGSTVQPVFGPFRGADVT